jgi:hypothetical protein
MAIPICLIRHTNKHDDVHLLARLISSLHERGLHLASSEHKWRSCPHFVWPTLWISAIQFCKPMIRKGNIALIKIKAMPCFILLQPNYLCTLSDVSVGMPLTFSTLNLTLSPTFTACRSDDLATLKGIVIGPILTVLLLMWPWLMTMLLFSLSTSSTTPSFKPGFFGYFVFADSAY